MSSRGTSDKESPIGIVPGWPFFVALSFILRESLFVLRESLHVPQRFRLRPERDDRLQRLFGQPSLDSGVAVGMFGTPGWIAVFLARQSLMFQLIWHAPFVLWTLKTFEIYSRSGLTIDGQNGCEYCDFSIFAMLVVGLLSLLPAAVIAVLKSARRERSEGSAA
jgi:hypothetical protein